MTTITRTALANGAPGTTAPSLPTSTVARAPEPTTVAERPDRDYDGPDRFTYKVQTREGLHEGSVSIDMAPQNDAPTMVIADRTEQPNVRPGPQVVPNFATQVSPGPGEDAQKLTLKVEATQPNVSIRGARKIPPPTPVTPEIKPIPAPAASDGRSRPISGACCTKR